MIPLIESTILIDSLKSNIIKNAGILRHVALVRTDVSVECIALIIRVEIISEVGNTLELTSSENCILHIHDRENLKILHLIFSSDR
jgi:hypothetical protein